MPEIKIVTEVAGRVCALPVEVGGSVGDGDDIAFVEAMKMEIPVASTCSGQNQIDTRQLDDVVAEGQVVADRRNLALSRNTLVVTICPPQSGIMAADESPGRCHRNEAMT